MLIGCEERLLDECASTNDEAARWAREGAPEGAVVIADAQTRGRGRLGRSWHSPPGAALYFSTVLRPKIALHKLPPLTLAVGVALAESVARFDVNARLKWPNDVLVDGKKLAGILTESAVQGGRLEHVIVGIGVNLHVEDLPPELNAISLHRFREVDRFEFVKVLSERLAVWYQRFLDGDGVAQSWKGFADCWGRTLEVSSGRENIRGVAEDLEDDGALRLRTDQGIVRIHAGEVVG